MKYNRYVNLFRNTILFALGQFGTMIIGVLLVPIYTDKLNAAEYGTADLVTNMSSMLLPLLTIGITDGIIKFSFDGKHDKKKIFTASFMVTAVGLLFSIILFPLIQKFGKIDEYILLFYMILWTSIMSNLFLVYTKALQRIQLYTILALIKTIATMIPNIILLVVFPFGINGYLISYVIGNTVCIVVAIFTNGLWKYISIKQVHKGTVKEMVRFSLPLVPNNISIWAMGSMDKYMITYMMGANFNGLYSVAHKLPSIISMLSSVFNQAWNYSALEEQNSSTEDKHEYYRKIFRIYTSFMFTACSLGMIFVKPVMLLWVGEEFKSAWIFAPYLFVSVVFSCLTSFYVPMFVEMEKTNYLFISTTIGAIINLILNYFLIKIWGVNGAAFATVVTYFVVWIIRDILIEKGMHLRLKKFVPILTSILLVIQATILTLDLSYWFIYQVLFCVIVILFNLKDLKSLFVPIVGYLKKKKSQ